MDVSLRTSIVASRSTRLDLAQPLSQTQCASTVGGDGRRGGILDPMPAEVHAATTLSGQADVYSSSASKSDDFNMQATPAKAAAIGRSSGKQGSASCAPETSGCSPSSTTSRQADHDRKPDSEAKVLKESDKSKDKQRETRLPACEACRTRKVKCDALLPACTPCQKSGRECFGRDKAPNVSRGLVYELQQKVKDLEGRLALASSGLAFSGSSNAHADAGSDHASASGSRSSRFENPPAKRPRRGRNGRPSLNNDTQSDESDEGSTSSSSSAAATTASDSTSSSPNPTDPSPNDFIQQTSTILESLSSDLAGSAHRHAQQTSDKSSTQMLDNDEACVLAALTRHHKDRTKSPHRLKRRSSSNASKYRDEASSYFSASSSRLKDASTSHHLKSRSRPGRMGTISTYERTFFDRLIARYLTYMNTSLSVINEVRMWEIAAMVYQDDERSRMGALSMGSHNSMAPPPLPPSPAIDRMTLSRHRYVVLMSLAIALASLGRSHNFSPELRRLGHQYWAEAQALYPVVFRINDLGKLRASLLQLQYALLVPTSGSVWELSGAAMRLVTELNLQVDREYDTAANAPFTQETIDMRRRLFWTTYCLDRSLAVALARPPGLSDAWIHVQLPSLVSDAELVRSHSEASDSIQSGQARTDAQKDIFRAHINLRRIQSEILCRLHSVNPRDYSLDNDGVHACQSPRDRPSLALVMEVGPPTPNVEWQTRMMDKLVEWRSEYDRIRFATPCVEKRQLNEGVSSTASPFITRDWIDLNHNLTISLLFRPSPNNPRPDSFGLQQAFMASGRAMKIYKSMHRSCTINFPWLATHHLFISGLTHLNALEKLTRTGVASPSPVVEVVFNVQSCASTLEALTTRDGGYGTRIRDTFDAAASAVLRSVLEPTGAGKSADTTAGSELASSVEDLMRGSAASSMARHVHATLGETRRASSHQEALLHVAQQQHHPTWLSDSTWNSINALEAAPPPGSTIFVAAPPRTARFGTPGHSLVPTLSERTTQTTRMQGAVTNSTLGALEPGVAHTSPRAFGIHAPYASGLSTSIPFGNSDALHVDSGATSLVADTKSKDNATLCTVETGSADRTSTSTFGFHNWLLQPYEGGADVGEINVAPGVTSTAFGTAENALAFTSSASSYAGVLPFSSVYPDTDAVAGQQPRPTTGDAEKMTHTEALAWLDILSMMPPTAAPAAAGAKASPSAGTRRAKR